MSDRVWHLNEFLILPSEQVDNRRMGFFKIGRNIIIVDHEHELSLCDELTDTILNGKLLHIHYFISGPTDLSHLFLVMKCVSVSSYTNKLIIHVPRIFKPALYDYIKSMIPYKIGDEYRVRVLKETDGPRFNIPGWCYFGKWWLKVNYNENGIEYTFSTDYSFYHGDNRPLTVHYAKEAYANYLINNKPKKLHTKFVPYKLS